MAGCVVRSTQDLITIHYKGKMQMAEEQAYVSFGVLFFCILQRTANEH